MEPARTTINGRTNYFIKGEKVRLASDPLKEAEVASICVILSPDSVEYQYTISLKQSSKLQRNTNTLETLSITTVVGESELLKIYRPATLTFEKIIATS